MVNGLGFEGWIDRLVKVSGYKGPVVVASEGIAALIGRGRTDPTLMSWQDLANGRLDVANIARALAAADPAHADDYRRRAEAYDRELAALDRDIRNRLGAFPADRRKVITSHDAFQYFGRAYGIDFHAPMGLSTESEPSAGEVAALIRQMREEGIHAPVRRERHGPALGRATRTRSRCRRRRAGSTPTRYPGPAALRRPISTCSATTLPKSRRLSRAESRAGAGAAEDLDRTVARPQ